ncbi:MAG TPA: super-infection exclusion protein B [Terriglobales bacterium]|nr:super-infection exclusion protein B [Terriglobales bacterium]
MVKDDNTRLMPSNALNPLEIINAFFQWFKGRYQAMFALFVLSGAGLFMPEWLLQRWHVSTPLHNEYLRFGLLFLFGFSFLYLTIGGWGWCVLFVAKLWHLHHLPSDERNIVLSFIDHDQRTTGFSLHSPSAHALERKGILSSCDRAFNPVARGGAGCFFTMPRWIFTYIKKRPHLYKDF